MKKVGSTLIMKTRAEFILFTQKKYYHYERVILYCFNLWVLIGSKLTNIDALYTYFVRFHLLNCFLFTTTAQLFIFLKYSSYSFTIFFMDRLIIHDPKAGKEFTERQRMSSNYCSPFIYSPKTWCYRLHCHVWLLNLHK